MSNAVESATTADEPRCERCLAVETRLALLSEAGARIGATLDVRHAARELVAVAVPRFADAAGLYMLERFLADDKRPDRQADGAAMVRRIAVDVAGADPSEWGPALPLDEIIVHPVHSTFAQCVASGEPALLSRLETHTAARIQQRTDRPEIARYLLDYASLLVTPLKARGTVLGLTIFARKPGRSPFDEQEVALGSDLAARVAACMDNARLYGRERRTARTLQSSLLPTELDVPANLDIAHRYLPADDETPIGGDWYDAIELPGGRVGLVVGDAMGHDMAAAASMAQLRTAVRALAGVGLSAVEVLRQVDLVAQRLDATQFATCLYADFDPDSGSCTIARAGHMRPLLAYPDGDTQILDGPPGLPLGIGEGSFESIQVTVPSGATIVLFSDGLVEDRERDMDVGVEVLRSVLANLSHDGVQPDLECACDAIMKSLRRDYDGDDITLLLARAQVAA